MTLQEALTIAAEALDVLGLTDHKDRFDAEFKRIYLIPGDSNSRNHERRSEIQHMVMP